MHGMPARPIAESYVEDPPKGAHRVNGLSRLGYYSSGP